MIALEPESRSVARANLAEEKSKIVSSMTQIDAELSGLKRNSPKRAELARQKRLLLGELENVKREIARNWSNTPDASSEDCPLTDHAVVRWLERKHGIDMPRLKSMILTPELLEAISSGLKFWSDGKVVFCMGDGRVQTVIPINQLPTRNEIP